MKLTRTVLPLLLVGMACGYLLGISDRYASATGDTGPVLLLSRPTPLPTMDRAGPSAPDSIAAVPLVDDALSDLVLTMPPPPPVGVPESVVVDGPVQEVELPDRVVWAVVTAYCPCRRCCGRHANGRTSTGSSAWKRGAAVDPGAIPYGSRIFVPGYGFALVDDTGGAMRRLWRNERMVHVDVRMTYHWQARQWGRKVLQVQVYASGTR